MTMKKNNFVEHHKQVEGLLRKRTLRCTGQHQGQGSGHASFEQGSSSARMSTNIPKVSVDIPRDGDPRVGPLDLFLTKRREK
ncbi:hypothetical protein Taro_051596 [Colocasia esculenta]|uniref:Uncharacterized protein n=1 Tax=Colocasia esculenta TaxID=4460 RepID=A0A843XHA9_COLES|nr:hypothetical protein [Colocasia esculenta]